MIRFEYASWIAVFVLPSIRMAFKLNAENGYQNPSALDSTCCDLKSLQMLTNIREPRVCIVIDIWIRTRDTEDGTQCYSKYRNIYARCQFLYFSHKMYLNVCILAVSHCWLAVFNEPYLVGFSIVYTVTDKFFELQYMYQLLLTLYWPYFYTLTSGYAMTF